MADLGKFGIRYKELVLVNSFAEKAEVIARLGIDVYFDDQDEILQHIGANVTVLKMRNGGNYDAEQRKWLYMQPPGDSCKPDTITYRLALTGLAIFSTPPLHQTFQPVRGDRWQWRRRFLKRTL